MREERRMRIESEPAGQAASKRCWPPRSTRILIAYRPSAGPATSKICALTTPRRSSPNTTCPPTSPSRIVGDVDPARMKSLADGIFRPASETPPAAARHHRRAGAGRPEARGGGIARAAHRSASPTTGPISTTKTIRCSTSWPSVLSGGRTSIMYTRPGSR